MKQALFIRLGSTPDSPVWWCALQAGVASTPERLDGWDQLSQLRSHPLSHYVCLLLPTSDLIFRRFKLPKKWALHQTPQFTWIAEDSLMGEIDDLHWTVMRRAGGELDTVAVRSVKLQQWLDACSNAGLKVIQALPDALLLPENPQGHTLVSLEDQWWVRYDTGASVVETPLLPELLVRLPQGTRRSYGDLPEGITTDEANPWQHPLLLIQERWRAERLNVLHGVFSQTDNRAEILKRWKKPLIFSVILAFCLSLFPQFAVLWNVKGRQNALAEETRQVYQRYLPGEVPPSNLKYHFEKGINKAKSGFFTQLAQLDMMKQAYPDIEVRSVKYDGKSGALTLDVSSMEKDRISAFVTQTQPIFGFTLQPGSTNPPYTGVLIGGDVAK
ncbi:type II secretion system protein GspL [Budviciaceae bacterium CWB-B4]|uniref:Type II secretion system protein L n=1 Tax=Limnobaculum xujianqingii TaxID=2738837 RepID=A0A9D7FVI7_9GAMM|nr:type II secretion system protein GspL [Limnobaculum xujianqingii]MBK5071536.1 type II secretion system protein GspL [Limnobaculum xujianqingii]MBK5174845.1 type II secretion system protein GspL [Limnobaculum xujianqingii]